MHSEMTKILLKTKIWNLKLRASWSFHNGFAVITKLTRRHFGICLKKKNKKQHADVAYSRAHGRHLLPLGDACGTS